MHSSTMALSHWLTMTRPWMNPAAYQPGISFESSMNDTPHAKLCLCPTTQQSMRSSALHTRLPTLLPPSSLPATPSSSHGPKPTCTPPPPSPPLPPFSPASLQCSQCRVSIITEAILACSGKTRLDPICAESSSAEQINRMLAFRSRARVQDVRGRDQ